MHCGEAASVGHAELAPMMIWTPLAPRPPPSQSAQPNARSPFRQKSDLIRIQSHHDPPLFTGGLLPLAQSPDGRGMPRPTMARTAFVVRAPHAINSRGQAPRTTEITHEKNTINGAIGATFTTPQAEKLLIERELGDGLLHVITVPGGSVYRVEDPETGELVLPDTHWLERGLADSSLRLYADDKGVITPERKLAKVFDRELILKLDPYAKARLAVMLPLLERGMDSTDPRLGGEIKKAWTRELQAEFGDRPETATVRDWFGRCRAPQSNSATCSV